MQIMSKAPSRSNATFVLTLVAIAAVSPLALNMYLPSLPTIAEDFGASVATVQLTLSLFLAALALGQLIAGPMSDRFGRRPLLLGGLAVFAAGSLICMTSQSAEMLIFGRIVQAIGGCAGITLSRAIIGDVYDSLRVSAMIGYVTMGMSVAPMVAPTIGGALETAIHWRASFAVLAAFGLLVLAVSFFKIPETKARASTGEEPWWKHYIDLLRSRLIWGYMLTIGLSSATILSFLAGAPYIVVEQMGVSPAAYGLFSAIIPFGYIVGNYFTGRFSARLGVFRTMSLGMASIFFAVISMTSLAYAGIAHPLALFIPASFLSLGNGLVMPASIAGAMRIKPTAFGAATGIAGCCQFGFAALAAPISGFLFDGTIWPVIIVLALCATLGCFTLLLARPAR